MGEKNYLPQPMVLSNPDFLIPYFIFAFFMSQDPFMKMCDVSFGMALLHYLA